MSWSQVSCLSVLIALVSLVQAAAEEPTAPLDSLPRNSVDGTAPDAVMGVDRSRGAQFSFSAPPGSIDRPYRDDIIDANANPIDLSNLTPVERAEVVKDYYRNDDPEWAVYRGELQTEWRFNKGVISKGERDARLGLRRKCRYGPTQAPKGMTERRLGELSVDLKRRQLTVQQMYKAILSEPEREWAPGEEPEHPLTFSMETYYDPNAHYCYPSIREKVTGAPCVTEARGCRD